MSAQTGQAGSCFVSGFPWRQTAHSFLCLLARPAPSAWHRLAQSRLRGAWAGTRARVSSSIRTYGRALSPTHPCRGLQTGIVAVPARLAPRERPVNGHCCSYTLSVCTHLHLRTQCTLFRPATDIPLHTHTHTRPHTNLRNMGSLPMAVVQPLELVGIVSSGARTPHPSRNPSQHGTVREGILWGWVLWHSRLNHSLGLLASHIRALRF